MHIKHFATRGLSRQQAANKGSCIYYILSGFVPHITMWFSHHNLYMQQGWCMCNQTTWSVYDVCLVVIFSVQGFHCCDHPCVTCHSAPCCHGTGQLHLTWSDLSMSTGVLPELAWPAHVNIDHPAVCLYVVTCILWYYWDQVLSLLNL